MSPSIARLVGGLAALVMTGLFAGSAAAQSSAIIYRDGRVLVRRVVGVTVPRGTSEHRIELDQFDPGSLVALDSGVVIVQARYPRQLDESTLYRAMLGRRLVFQAQGGSDTVSALILGEDPVRFEMAEGQVRLDPPGIPLFPRDVVGASRSTLLTVSSERALRSLTLGYLTDGTTWRAEYTLVLSGSSALVSGRVTLVSTEFRADSTEIAVLEGQVGRGSGFRRQGPAARDAAPREDFVLRGIVSTGQLGAEPVGVGSFRLYPVPGRYNLLPGATTVAPLFPALRTAVQRVHTVAGRGLDPGGEGVLPVEVRYRITRPHQSPFGNKPLPPGLVRLYTSVMGASILVGEVALAHAEPGSMLDLVAGHALDLSARRMPARVSTVADTTIQPGRRPQITQSGRVADGEIHFSNASDSLATVEFTEPLTGSAILISSSIPAERTDRALRFTVRVPPRDEVVLRYRVRMTP